MGGGGIGAGERDYSFLQRLLFSVVVTWHFGGLKLWGVDDVAGAICKGAGCDGGFLGEPNFSQ